MWSQRMMTWLGTRPGRSRGKRSARRSPQRTCLTGTFPDSSSCLRARRDSCLASSCATTYQLTVNILCCRVGSYLLLVRSSSYRLSLVRPSTVDVRLLVLVYDSQTYMHSELHSSCFWLHTDPWNDISSPQSRLWPTVSLELHVRSLDSKCPHMTALTLTQQGQPSFRIKPRCVSLTRPQYLYILDAYSRHNLPFYPDYLAFRSTFTASSPH